MGLSMFAAGASRSRSWATAAILATALVVTGCATQRSTDGSIGPRSEESLRAELANARKFDDQILKEKPLYKDKILTDYVAAIGNKIQAQRPPGVLPVKVRVLDDDTPNAFTIGGGYVYFNTGLIEIMENEAQLAMVMAHELAHGDADHINEGRNAQQTAAILGALGGIAAGVLIGGNQGKAAGALVGLGVTAGYMKFSRDQEREADRIGYEYLRRAGYDGREGALTFAQLEKVSGGQKGALAAYFSTHPLSSERKETLAALARNDPPGGFVGAEDYQKFALNRLK